MGLRTAIRTLTILPIRESKRPDFGRAVLFFPLVGLILGMILWLLVELFNTLFPRLNRDVLSVALLMISALLTGGLHLDGLGDFLDSLGGGNRERRLEIMKDRYMGAFGVVGICLFLLLKYAGIKGLLLEERSHLILIPMLLSRTSMGVLCAYLPYARDEGTGRPFVQMEEKKKVFLISAISFISPLLLGVGPLVVSIICFLATLFLMHYYRTRYGGITGDLLGATNEMVEVLGFGLFNFGI